MNCPVLITPAVYNALVTQRKSGSVSVELEEQEKFETGGDGNTINIQTEVEKQTHLNIISVSVMRLLNSKILSVPEIKQMVNLIRVMGNQDQVAQVV